MEYIVLTTSGFSVAEAESKNEVKRNFEKTRVSGEWIVWIQEKQILTNNKTTMTTTAQMAPAIIKEEESPVLAQKRQRWGDLGVRIHEADLELQVRAQSSIAKLITPTKMEDVLKAEAMLKEVKAEGVALKNERLSITKPVSDRMSELMLPEKSFEEPCKKVEQAIITLKKADEQRRLLENQKLDALRNCREFLTTTRNNADATFRNKILDKVGKVYEHALGKGEVDLPMLPEYIDFALTRMHAVDFEILYPQNSFQLVTADQYQALCVELLTFDSKIYLADYENQLRKKFSDYEVALNNKATALAIAKQESASKAAEIQSNASNANVAAKLETVAITPVVSVGTKALKQSYVVEMPETVESALTILTAFSAHVNLCLSKLNINKWFAFTPAQAAVALAKVKMDDETFAPAGIIFKSVDKL